LSVLLAISKGLFHSSLEALVYFKWNQRTNPKESEKVCSGL